MRTFEDKAFAKLNLYLGIHGLREDGYHELETVFQTIDLCDLVSLTVHDKGGISFRCNLPYLPTDGRNLAVKAAEAFFRACGMENPGLNINIKKVIPVGAGMAGGSTDAACVLKLLNRAYGKPMSEKALLEVALSLGADVPFCLTGGTALAAGVGEKLRPLAPMPDCWIIVCKPRFSVSTKDAFALYDTQPPESVPSSQGMLQGLARGDLRAVADQLYNGLEEPVGSRRRFIFKLRRELLRNGALGARMTGSGSAVFGIFDSEEQAKAALAPMKKLCILSFLCRPRNDR